ncbi:disease resistance protein (TIR-NBS-LRR class) family [Artemisia annua]|uniref:Disease resistance protein (TIR-NBS-LRR class) family n=1 Tax=Artemisia annua TaxID=35608 RepID=A0A2U1Q8F2_ARTAN|nr:disease resistance protein (TIR-NBS-LRR class) family [Artemisia annua]
MASTSTSSIQKSFKYDVFLSFRGEDTRYNFVSHLYKALEQQGIQTYKDDEKIEKGEMIDTQLIKSIEDSRFYIIVFSRNYASSSWCLNELVKIMECQKVSEQTAYPVFYDVEPMEIRKQSGAVEEAFRKHENKEASRKWRKALNEAGNLAGWESKTTANGDESKLIQIIVDVIFKKKCSSSSSVDGKLVGMETRIEAVLSSLELDADDVRMIGIWGMGGGGKTTLARAVFDQIFIHFDCKAFVENVREVSKSSLYGLNKLQQQILRSVLSDKNIAVRSVHEGTNMMKTLLRGRKVLIVLDDVDDTEQLEALAGEPNDWFKFGSRVIITTRDKQVLSPHGVKFIDVNLLSRAEAICLLSKNAFKREIPIEGYEELSEEVVQYADGLPLTIKVLGSFLHGLNVPEWKDTLNRLKEIPLKAVMEKLELSYNGLEEDYKEIFLDVACLLKGWEKDDAIRALESCGFRARIGLRVLELKSLISISSKYGQLVLSMHDHIQEMGKNIVRRLNPYEPEMHSRLWIHNEIKDILANNKGTQATKCIALNANGLNFEILMNGLANMKELRFLRVYAPYPFCSWRLDEVGLHLPNALRFLSWDNYPFSSLPKTFQAKNLVGLDMFNSKMVQLWKDGEEKACLKLRFLKFTFSKLRTLDLSVALNLETLILENCRDLVEVHFHVNPNLKELRINSCNRLEKLHMPAESRKLRSLDHSSLKKLRTFHLGITAECPKLVTLHLNDNAKLRTLDLGLTPNLQWLYLRNCYDLEEINAPAECLKKLLHLNIIYCGRFKYFKFDKKLDSPEFVSLHLTAYKTGICDPGNTWPEFQFTCYYNEDSASSFGNLERLISLGFGAHINVDSLSDIICGLQCLRKLTLEGGIPEAPKNLDRLDCLEELSLWYADIKTLPDGICMLKHLKSLELESCLLLEKLPVDIGRLECLESLILFECTLLQDIPNSICEMKRLEHLVLSQCIRVEKLPEEFGRLKCLKELKIQGTWISHLPQSIFGLKGLRIVGDRWFLESCGLIPKTRRTSDEDVETFCYI